MKLYKLITHQRNFSAEDLILNPKDHPDAKIGDVVEIYLPGDDGIRLLLQITLFQEDKKGTRDVISIDASVAAAFNLPTYSEVIMQIIDPTTVALDSLEISFKDQYMGRSEMWRLKTHLTNTCVFVNKKIEYCSSTIRCQVHEMWSQGDRVACGVITEDTKIVFRSSTSMVYLFIQMSSEMWDFDIHGDLYFEKAVNGFLTELFSKWKKMGCNHEVTIVLFSRTFYAANSLEEFPMHMRDCLQIDYKGRFYEDFYRVAIQNERYDDWSLVLVQLRKLFTAYQNMVLHYHAKPGITVPTATNSTAAQGNFLEVLNISLNVFEKHYLDRSFDRTGQLSVVITPGVGVFEVDRELTNITKQRIIDNGVGSDLVCVGEQPLHAVPLLKFHNKDSSFDIADDYSMPHWINLSFYSTNKKVAYSTFIPRIKLPPVYSTFDVENKNEMMLKYRSYTAPHQSEYIYNSIFDYDTYDAQIFTLPTVHGTRSLQRIGKSEKATFTTNFSDCSAKDLRHAALTKRFLFRKHSEPDIHYGNSDSMQFSSTIFPKEASPVDKKSKVYAHSVEPVKNGRAGRALINPFAPSNVTIKLTSNRRRWTHIFPKGPTGVFIQQHHYQAIPTKSINFFNNASSSEIVTKSFVNATESLAAEKRKFTALHSPAGPTVTVEPSKTLTLLWGATGEQEWTPALTTGVDWKSLTIPACLPITTDYFPDQRSLHNDYVVSNYTLLPDSVGTTHRKPLTTDEVFRELISQRLAQGFQLIVLPDKNESYTSTSSSMRQFNNNGLTKTQTKNTFSSIANRPTITPMVHERTKEYFLSIGRIFHKISLTDSEITVTRYRPRHAYPPINVDYPYRFQATHHNTYEISGVNFTTEKLENFNWNLMDQYICTRGDIENRLQENLKYWRYRMYLLPKENPATRKIMESPTLIPCDIYTEMDNESMKLQIEEFVKFIESHINKIRKNLKTSAKVAVNSPFRERTGSNRLPIQRPRSGSKVSSLDRNGKTLQNTESSGISSSDSNFVAMNEEIEENTSVETLLSPSTPLSEILDAMRHPMTGVNFVAKNQNLPPYTFVSYDAVNWLNDHLDSSVNSLDILNHMRKERMICHSSGDFTKPIIQGYYLYYVVIHDKKSKEYQKPLCDSDAFENEWMEVELKCYDVQNKNEIPKFLQDSVEIALNVGPIYKQMYLEIDSIQKSDRVEWGHLRYHKRMTPGNAYELVVQWLTASGSIVNDLIYGWCRKAPQCGLQLISIPADLLAEPFTEKSDPLRGPIFIPLDLSCLEKNGKGLFDDYDKGTHNDRLTLFQEAIVIRFGFVPADVESVIGSNEANLDKQFVHCTGNMFILIPTGHQSMKHGQCSTSSKKQKESLTLKSLSTNRIPSDHRNAANNLYMFRHANVINSTNRKLGFLWSWNHMISNKRWRSLTLSGSAGGELLPFRILDDFREFCSNQNERLNEFWDECWAQKCCNKK